MAKNAHYQLPLKCSSIVYAMARKNLGLQVYQTVTVLKNLPQNTATMGCWQIMRRFVLPRKSIHTKLPDGEGISLFILTP